MKSNKTFFQKYSDKFFQFVFIFENEPKVRARRPELSFAQPTNLGGTNEKATKYHSNRECFIYEKEDQVTNRVTRFTIWLSLVPK